MTKRRIQAEDELTEDPTLQDEADAETVDDEVAEPGVSDAASGPWQADPSERRYSVSFALPMSILIATIDPTHSMADAKGAAHFGLLGEAPGELTPIGELVRHGFDQTAVGHKMNAASRVAFNAEVARRR